MHAAMHYDSAQARSESIPTGAGTRKPAALPAQSNPIWNLLAMRAADSPNQPGSGAAMATTPASGPAAVPISITRPATNLIQRSPAWQAARDLAIEMEPSDPTTPPQVFYIEAGPGLSQRMSRNLPVYQGAFCQNSLLPFNGEVRFDVDTTGDPRDQPFTPPTVSVDFRFSPRGGKGVSRSNVDSSPQYTGAGQPLKTSFPGTFAFTLDDNGPFSMTLKMFDPDSGLTRLYDDTIQVVAKRPCA